MSKHPTLFECHFSNFLEPPNANLQYFNLRLEFGFCLRRAYILPLTRDLNVSKGQLPWYSHFL